MDKIKQIISQIEICENWKEDYKKFVPRFIEEAKTKSRWQDWDKDVFYEYFERSKGQCVSSLKQGYFSNEEKEEIKQNWETEIAPILKKIAESQETLRINLYRNLDNVIRQHTSQHRRAAVNRLIAGLQPKILCTIINLEDLNKAKKLINNLLPKNKKIKDNDYFEISNRVIELIKETYPNDNVYDLVTIPWQLYETLSNKQIVENKEDMNLEKTLDLLKYKKQIILQGPPGTGKTREAKIIARELIKFHSIENKIITYNTLTQDIIKSNIKEGQRIKGKDDTNYEVISFKKNIIQIKSDKSKVWKPSYNKIIESYNNQLFNEKGRTGGLKSYEDAIAKYLFENLDNKLIESQAETLYKEEDFLQIIQFHPSYSYEDFVRGIVSKPNSNGDGITYEAENKILVKIAEKAWKNYKASSFSIGESDSISKDIWIDDKFNDFKSEIEKDVEEKEIPLSGNITIFKVDYDSFRYGKDWQTPSRINFVDFKNIIKAVLNGTYSISSQQIPKEISLHAHYRYTYYNALLKKFFDKYKYEEPVTKQDLKNYVLIIDEINRANLSSVLGELIYALEYRGEAVDSMYEVDGSNKIILPPNLYIIGTMNTADRSVGHIDYAIRRRFAFVDVLPKDLSEEVEIFNRDLFYKVASLFDNHLSQEFKKEEVQLGHSYFITENTDIQTRLQYEIKPILREYVKDGVLKESASDEIEKL